MNNMDVSVKEPLVRFVKRTDISKTKVYFIRLAAIVMSLFVAAVVLFGHDCCTHKF